MEDQTLFQVWHKISLIFGFCQKKIFQFSESILISQSPILSSFLTTTTIPITTIEGDLPNDVCSPYVIQYLNLSSPVRTKIFDYIYAHHGTNIEALAQEMKVFIETLLSDGGLSASDSTSLLKFTTEELVPQVSTITCFLAYELNTMN